MKTRSLLIVATLMILLVLGIVACGKGSSPSATDNTDKAATSETINAQYLNDTPVASAGTTDGLKMITTPLGTIPALPDESRSLSATIALPATINGDQVKKIGDKYQMSEGCTIDGTALVMDSGDRTKRKIAWAMYEVGGFDPKSDQLLSMASKFWLDQDRVDVNKSGYFIAVSNFSKKSWEWHGPFKVPETEFILHPKQIHTSVSGYLYYMLVVFDGDKGTHELTTIMEGTAPEPTKLTPPTKLVASDGKHNTPIQAAGVLIHWEVSDGAVMYVVERKHLEYDPAKPNQPLDTKFFEIGRTPEAGFFDPKVYPGEHYLYRAFAIGKEQKSDYSNVDEGWWDGEEPQPPVDGKIVGLRVVIADKVTKKELGMFTTPQDATNPDLKGLVIPANTHLYGRVVTIMVQVVKEDNTVVIVEREPKPEDNIWWMTDGLAFPEPPPPLKELHTCAGPDTHPEKPAIGFIVCTIVPKEFQLPNPPRPIPNDMKQVPAVIIPTKLLLDERASNVKEVYTYDNAKLDPAATQHFYFRVEPEFVAPLLEIGEFNVAPEIVLTPVFATQDAGRPFEIDPARPHLRFKYCPEAFTVPSPGFFTAYAWPWSSEIKQWKFKVAYSPEICPPFEQKPGGGDPTTGKHIPHGLYRIRFMNNVGYSFGDNPLDPTKYRPGGGETPEPPAYGPDIDPTKGQFHLHPGNIFLPVKNVIEFL